MSDIQDQVCHLALFAFSTAVGYSLTHKLIPVMSKHLLNKLNLYGYDMGRDNKVKIPESLGIVAGLVYLLSYVTFFIIVPYLLYEMDILTIINLPEKLCSSHYDGDNYGYNNGLANAAAMVSIFAMLILGFIDDLYDLRWRYKIVFPFAASIPLLAVYYHSFGERTIILVPTYIARYLNLEEYLDIGLFYYIYMLMFVIFCTNAINIHAGINGLEVGQTIVWTVTIILYNLIEITTQLECDEVHVLSLQLLLPFLLCSIALYEFNRYPAQVFVGDSYCYFAGITIAVVGVLGHFSEEILIFAAPQVFNFILSIPQIFKIVPCPRHRLPKFHKDTRLREPSTFEFRYSEMNILGRMIVRLFAYLGFANLKVVQEAPLEGGENNTNQNGPLIKDLKYSCNNFTLLNLWLCWFGPKSERALCHEILKFQSSLSFMSLAALTFIKMNYV